MHSFIDYPYIAFNCLHDVEIKRCGDEMNLSSWGFIPVSTPLIAVCKRFHPRTSFNEGFTRVSRALISRCGIVLIKRDMIKVSYGMK